MRFGGLGGGEVADSHRCAPCFVASLHTSPCTNAWRCTRNAYARVHSAFTCFSAGCVQHYCMRRRLLSKTRLWLWFGLHGRSARGRSWSRLGHRAWAVVLWDSWLSWLGVVVVLCFGVGLWFVLSIYDYAQTRLSHHAFFACLAVPSFSFITRVIFRRRPLPVASQFEHRHP